MPPWVSLLLLPSLSWAIVYLATDVGELPVIPFFDYAGCTYPVDSPMSLSGRAVAALFNNEPGYVQCWIPEAGATKAELNSFLFLERYGDVTFERWQVDPLKCPKRLDNLELPDLKRIPSETVFEKLPNWSKLRYVDLLAKDDEDAKKLLGDHLYFGYRNDAILNLFSAIGRPLIGRIRGFFEEVEPEKIANSISSYSSFYFEMTKYALQEHGYFPNLPDPLIKAEGAKVLLNHGFSWFKADDAATLMALNSMTMETFGDSFITPKLDHFREAVLLHNLKKSERLPLNRHFANWIASDADPDPCHLLVALHMSPNDSALIPFLLKGKSLRAMSPHTRAFLKKHHHGLPAINLVRFGFYDIDDFSQPGVLLQILKNQPSYLLDADPVGFMRFASRIAPLVKSELSGAPWQVLMCMLQSNRMKREALLALLGLPEGRLNKTFEVQFDQWVKVNVSDLFHFIDDIVAIDTAQSRKIVSKLIQWDPISLIDHLCLPPAKVKSTQMQQSINQTICGLEGYWGPMVGDYRDLIRWSQNCLPEYKETFKWWLEKRHNTGIFSKKRLFFLF